METTDRSAEIADRLRLSYRPAEHNRADEREPDPDERETNGFAGNHLVHDRIRERPFRAYLRRVHGGDVSVGDEWDEFVNCGCGTTTDVLVRVEAVEGGAVFGDETEIVLAAAGGAREQSN